MIGVTDIVEFEELNKELRVARILAKTIRNRMDYYAARMEEEYDSMKDEQKKLDNIIAVLYGKLSDLERGQNGR